MDKLQFDPTNLQDVRNFIHDMFLNEEIGTYGERNWNGADSYHCISCYASKDIKGHCSSKSSHLEVEHAPDCKQDALYRWTTQGD